MKIKWEKPTVATISLHEVNHNTLITDINAINNASIDQIYVVLRPNNANREIFGPGVQIDIAEDEILLFNIYNGTFRKVKKNTTCSIIIAKPLKIRKAISAEGLSRLHESVFTDSIKE